MKRMLKTHNLDIRRETKKAGLYLWQIAERLEITPSMFSIELRKEMPEERKSQIRKAIKELTGGVA